MVIEAADVTVGYEGRTVVRGAALTVAAGEAVTLLGANGSGKSTLVRATLGLVPLQSGEVTLFDVPVHRFRQRWRIGYVPQRLSAAGGVPATVAEVVAAGRLARRRIPLPATRADRSAVDAALDAVDLIDRRRDPVATLSGGQQQRVLIARALAAQPDLLVMDEPTAGVDAASQETLASVLADHTADGGAVLLVAHELGPLADVIDRAVVLSHGEVVHDGPVPRPVGPHADPDHDHVHPHAEHRGGLWSAA